MTPDEEQRVTRLVERIAAQPSVPKDADAVSALAQLLRRRPDAAYWLLRRCVLLETAIEGGSSPAPPAPAAPAGGMAPLQFRETPPAAPAVPAAPAPAAEPQLRDLLGEFTNTSLLGDLSEPELPKPGRAAAASVGPQLRDLLGEFTNTSLLGDLSEPAEPPRDAPRPPQRR